MTHKYRDTADTFATDLAKLLIQEGVADRGDPVKALYAQIADEQFRKLAGVLGYRVERISDEEGAE